MDVHLLLLRNTTDVSRSKSIELIFTLVYVLRHILCYTPLVMFLLGLIGFVGNTITYLQPELRHNTCCLYTFFGSIVDIVYLCLYAIPDFFATRFELRMPWAISDHACRMLHFLRSLTEPFHQLLGHVDDRSLRLYLQSDIEDASAQSDENAAMDGEFDRVDQYALLDLRHSDGVLGLDGQLCLFQPVSL